MTVETIYRAIDAIAPFCESMDFDNTGILIGNPQAAVSDVLICLDVTPRDFPQARRTFRGEHAVCARSQRCLGDQRAYKPR